MSSQVVVAPTWRVLGRSVTGRSHQRRGLENQDAVAFWPEDDVGPVAILAVADGHGSKENARSGEGSRLAVATAVQLLRDLLPAVDVGDAAERCLLAELLAGEWRRAVLAHLKEHPWTEAPETANGHVARDPVILYGTTLLVAAVLPEYLLLLQIGDGDILLVSPEGAVARPFEPDPRLLANATTSLCASNAALEIRHKVIPLSGGALALVLLSTDGYANSFKDDAGFLQVGADLLEMIRGDGLEAVAGCLEGWLNETSERGSGDDVTLGLLCRSDIAGSATDERAGTAGAGAPEIV